jgi:malate dehydrogenase
MGFKVTVIGAGAVGATCADVIARRDFCKEVVLVDVKEGLAEGKALDIYQASAIAGFDTRVIGTTGDYSLTANSDVVVITAGKPRSPGMSRDDLINVNAEIVKNVVEQVVNYCPNTILVVVSNPLDVMTYHALKISGFPKERVVGMAGILDTARYRAFLAMELNCSPKDIQALLMGGHGDTMVPLPSYTTISGIPVTQFLDRERLNAIIERTKYGGGELTKLIGTSAWIAPGTATAQMVEAILLDQKRILPCCAYLEGEYGVHDLCVGVPVKLGRNGVEEVIEIPLRGEEREAFDKSVEAVRQMVKVLYP